MYVEQGKIIKELRLSKNLKRKDVAKKSGLSCAQITNIEKGNSKPKIGTLYKLVQSLECDYDFIFKLYY